MYEVATPVDRTACVGALTLIALVDRPRPANMEMIVTAVTTPAAELVELLPLS